MRGNTGYKNISLYGDYLPRGRVVKNTYVTNVTNITNVVAHPHFNGGKHHFKHCHREHERTEKPPKLARFCASGGLLDQDVAMRMSGGELFSGIAAVGGYAARGVVKHTGNIIRNNRDLGEGICEMGKGVCDIVKSIGMLVSMIL